MSCSSMPLALTTALASKDRVAPGAGDDEEGRTLAPLFVEGEEFDKAPADAEGRAPWPPSGRAVAFEGAAPGCRRTG